MRKHIENQYHVGDFICDKILLKFSTFFMAYATIYKTDNYAI